MSLIFDANTTYRYGTDCGKLFVKTIVQLDVGVALDTGAADPVPSVLPSNGGSAKRGNLGTVGARGCATLSPLIEEEGVWTSGNSIPITCQVRSDRG